MDLGPVDGGDGEPGDVFAGAVSTAGRGSAAVVARRGEVVRAPLFTCSFVAVVKLVAPEEPCRTPPPSLPKPMWSLHVQ